MSRSNEETTGRSGVRRFVIPAAIFALHMCVMGQPASAAGDASHKAASVYSSAEDCAECHTSIHEYWASSRHALSASSPTYLKALGRAIDGADDEMAVRRLCVWCHAPTTLVTGDLELKQPISREGITCDFCHTVKDVDMEREGHPFVLEPGNVKRGPLEFASTIGHENAYSSLHRASPLLCASCHEYMNANGVLVLSTYTEWKEGPYPERGVPCQDCHMPLVPGTTVKEEMREKDSLRVVNLHRLMGGSARSQVARGIDLSIKSMSRTGGNANLSVVVANVAAGHAVPGGLSTKSLVLTVGVEMTDGTLKYRRTRVYRRELKDRNGRALDNVADLFLKAASVGRDNRIKPRESRVERFNIPIPEGATAIVAMLDYLDSSDPDGEPRTTRITEVRRELTRR